VLYAGVIIEEGQPKLIEFNVRFGDPECQPLILRLKSDLLPALIATRDGELKDFDLRWHDEASLCVVMAAKGYPGDYAKNTEIKGLDRAGKVEGTVIFHAGTAEKDGKILATGGRVLGVTARGKTVEEARARAYRAVDLIDWPQGFCRRDIAWRAISSRS
jgi:phosphoribosylamine--glycine ligase